MGYVDDFMKKVDYTKEEAKKTGKKMERGLDKAFETGGRVADKTAEVAGPALDRAEEMAAGMDDFMEHENDLDDPAEPAAPRGDILPPIDDVDESAGGEPLPPADGSPGGFDDGFEEPMGEPADPFAAEFDESDESGDEVELVPVDEPRDRDEFMPVHVDDDRGGY